VSRDSLGLVRGPRRRGGRKLFTCSKRRDRGTKALRHYADRGTKAVMPELVTPELTLVRVADKEALDKYATVRTASGARVNYQLKGILSQLTCVLTRLEGWTVGSTGVAEPMLMSRKCGKRRDEWR
jgi:hypothetical protein